MLTHAAVSVRGVNFYHFKEAKKDIICNNFLTKDRKLRDSSDLYRTMFQDANPRMANELK